MASVVPLKSTRELLNARDAREATHRIQRHLGALADLIECAYRGQAWVSLGYTDWDTYCAAEFEASKLPREKRTGTALALRDKGMSTRAIAAALGISKSQVGRDVGARDDAEVSQNGTPEVPATARAGAGNPAPDSDRRVTGKDGKSYPSRQPAKPKPDEPVDAEVVEVPFTISDLVTGVAAVAAKFDDAERVTADDYSADAAAALKAQLAGVITTLGRVHAALNTR